MRTIENKQNKNGTIRYAKMCWIVYLKFIAFVHYYFQLYSSILKSNAYTRTHAQCPFNSSGFFNQIMRNISLSSSWNFIIFFGKFNAQSVCLFIMFFSPFFPFGFFECAQWKLMLSAAANQRQPLHACNVIWYICNWPLAIGWAVLKNLPCAVCTQICCKIHN